MQFDGERQLVATVGADHVIKLWRVSEVLAGASMAGP